MVRWVGEEQKKKGPWLACGSLWGGRGVAEWRRRKQAQGAFGWHVGCCGGPGYMGGWNLESLAPMFGTNVTKTFQESTQARTRQPIEVQAQIVVGGGGEADTRSLG